MQRGWRRLIYWLRRRRAAEALAEELQVHREMAARDLENAGLTPFAADMAARRAMGNVTLAREDARQVWLAAWLEGLAQDVRHGVRSLRRSPGLVAISALSLGLGLGLNAILYMGFDTIMRHRPSMAEPARVVGVEPATSRQFSYPDYRDLADSGLFADALGYRATTVNLGAGSQIRRAGALAVTANFFAVLGVRPVIGRAFDAAAAALEREPRELIVTAGFWRSSMGGRRQAIGETLVLNGVSFTVIGVLPDDYRAVTGWVGPQIYVPLNRLVLPTLDDRGTPSLSVLARLRAGSTPAQVQPAVTALLAALERDYPGRLAAGGRPARVFPAEQQQFRGTEVRFQMLTTIGWMTVGLVLLMACVNVMGLLLARAASRRREIAIRVAVGGGRARLVQAMLVEGALLVAAGAAVGVPLAVALTRIPFYRPMAGVQDAMVPDSRLLPFGLVLLVLTALACAVLPALRATRGDVIAEVRQGGEGGTPRMRLRQILVAGQVAMSLVLTLAAALCVRSQIGLGRADLGFDIDHGVVARIGLEPGQYEGPARVRLAEQLTERVGRLPGVLSAAVADVVPLGGDSLLRSFHPAGRTDIEGTRPSTYSVGPRYFQSLAIPFRRGRDFADTDHAASVPVAIVNETYARTYFAGRNAIGERVQTVDEANAEIVGVVADHRIGTIGEAPQSVVFYPFAQRPRPVTVHIRTASSPDALVTAVERAVAAVDPALAAGVQTLRTAAGLELNMRRFATVLMGVMGAIGLLLAMIGIYGVMSYLAAARTAEVGIKMAFGATRARIQRDMLQRVLRVVAPGVVIGTVASLALMPAFSTFLAGVSPFDPLAFLGAAAVLTAVALAAGYVPARRSARLDPIRALRQL